MTTGSAFAVLNVGGATGLYSINLVNAQATFIGLVGNGVAAVQGLAIQSEPGGIPAVALSADGTSLARFNTATPGTVTTQALDLAAVVAGETLVAIDFRPQTGQLYAFGVDAAANTGTLYLVDPQTGVVAIAVAGTASAITFAGEDFPTVRLWHGFQSDGRPHPHHDGQRSQLPHQSQQRFAGGRDRGW